VIVVIVFQMIALVRIPTQQLNRFYWIKILFWWSDWLDHSSHFQYDKLPNTILYSITHDLRIVVCNHEMIATLHLNCNSTLLFNSLQRIFASQMVPSVVLHFQYCKTPSTTWYNPPDTLKCLSIKYAISALCWI
jgi:hypothetical protein